MKQVYCFKSGIKCKIALIAIGFENDNTLRNDVENFIQDEDSQKNRWLWKWFLDSEQETRAPLVWSAIKCDVAWKWIKNYIRNWRSGRAKTTKRDQAIVSINCLEECDEFYIPIELLET